MAKTKSQPLSRPPLERMMRFHNLIQESSFPNCTKAQRKDDLAASGAGKIVLESHPHHAII
jgi:hypothetical protein